MQYKPEELNIHELLSKDEYIIPIYQRNFAWGKEEIEQLLEDIKNKCEDNKNANYYIGTLVVCKNKNNKYVIIDGQQRFTVFTLINSIENDYNKIEHKINLFFETREEIDKYLKDIFNDLASQSYDDENRSGITHFKEARKIIESYFENNIKEKDYIEYLYEHTSIIRIEVPEDTNLNHYFEIMNTRGEQLEKHEILKARLMSMTDDRYKKGFAFIWNACADMDSYVVNKIKYKNLCDLNDLECKIEDILSNSGDVNVNKKIFLDILSQSPSIEDGNDKEDNNTKDDKYTSVIDFPNFLLQVLKLSDNSVSLDDKKLLNEFDKKIQETNFAKKFIISLLKCRIIFDKYIIKRVKNNNESRWQLLSPKHNDDNNFTLVNTISGTEDEDLNNNDKQEILIKLESMLEVSGSPKNYKEWLNIALKHLCMEGPFNADNFKDKLWKYAREIF